MTNFKSVDEYLKYSMDAISKFQDLRDIKGNAVYIEEGVRKYIPEAALCLSVTYVPYGMDMSARTVYLSMDVINSYKCARMQDEFITETLADYELLVNYKEDDLLSDITMSTLDDVQELLFVSLVLRAKLEYEGTSTVVYIDNSELLQTLKGASVTGSVDVTDLEIDAFNDYITTK